MSLALDLAETLRARLNSGVLHDVGPIRLSEDVVLDTEMAARITLADVESLTQLADARRFVADGRWQSVTGDLERLCEVSS